MSSAATLKAALRENNMTLEELCALSKTQAKRLPLVEDKVLAEANRQFQEKHLVVEVTVRVTLRDRSETPTLTPELIQEIRRQVRRGAANEVCFNWVEVELV